MAVILKTTSICHFLIGKRKIFAIVTRKDMYNEIYKKDILDSSGDGDLDIEPYDIMVEDSQDQKVRTYKEIINNNPCWIVEISDVPTNCFWSVGFMVTIDAQSGSVIAISHTR